jgi:hypothetical protein
MTLFTSFTAGGFDVSAEREQRTGMSRKWHGIHPRGSAWEVPTKRATAAAARTRKSFMSGVLPLVSARIRVPSIPSLREALCEGVAPFRSAGGRRQ